MSSKRGSYQVEVDARSADEAIAIAEEGLPRGSVKKKAETREVGPGSYEVTITFGPAPKD
jgi:hypothetical protein